MAQVGEAGRVSHRVRNWLIEGVKLINIYSYDPGYEAVQVTPSQDIHRAVSMVRSFTSN